MIDLPPPSEIVLERSLGRGERAEVFACKGGRFAIKRYFTKDQIDLPAKQLADYYYDGDGKFLGAERELEVAQRLLHPNVIRIYSLFFDGTTTYLVMDYIEGKRLDQITDEMRQAARDVVSVLRFALKENLIHHDLHSENFLVDFQGKIYFIDLDSFEEEDGAEDWDEYADHIYTFIRSLLQYRELETPSGLRTKEDLDKSLEELERKLLP
ncbi:MAG: protein kinase family protein [Verrucomicrobia bacterium]|nr:protein kinase family protein [Verrucomicrobiota bacterium]